MQPLLSKAPLMVVANPFASPLDADGNPCTFVQYDPEHSGGGVRYIGCVLDRKVAKPKVMTAARRREDRRQYAQIKTTVRYDLAPTPIVHSAYHRDMIRDGALLAADEATWKLAGMNGVFEAPKSIIERDCSARIREWLDAHPGEALTPASWFESTTPLINGLTLAARSPITASSVDERVEARKTSARLKEGDGLPRVSVSGDTLTEAPQSAGGTS